MAKGKVTGGENLIKIVLDAKYAYGVKAVKVGFFSTATYDDEEGTKVATVAAKNEFGVGVPERPFLRPTNEQIKHPVKEFLVKAVDPKKMVVTVAMADDIGQMVQNAVQRKITELRTPPNSPATIARKGSSNPLIDTGHMRASVTYKTVK